MKNFEIQLMRFIIYSIVNTSLLAFVVSEPSSIETSSSGDEPIVYVTFRRWENRTFSPRLYYIFLQQFGVKKKVHSLNLDEEEIKEAAEDAAVAVSKMTQEVQVQGSPGTTNQNGSTSPYEGENESSTDDDKIGSRTSLIGSTGLNIPSRKNNYLGVRKQRPSGFNYELFGTDLINSSVQFPSSDPTPPITTTTLDPNILASRLAFPGQSSRRNSQKQREPLVIVEEPEQLISFKTPNPPHRNTHLENPGPQYELKEEDSVDTINLTFEIIQRNGWKDENAVFSPLSIVNILGLFFLGSNGTTYTELANRLKDPNSALRFDGNGDFKFHVAFQRLIHFLYTSSGDKLNLEVCNGIFVDQRFPILSSYRDFAVDHYNAQVDPFDFGTQGEEFQRLVNSWIAHKTRNKITSIIEKPPEPTTTIALVNAIYFQGSWGFPFIKAITKTKPFIISETETIQVPMMSNDFSIPYLETDDFRVIGLPYKDNNTGFFIFLPNEPGVRGLEAMERKFSSSTLQLLENMKMRQVAVQLPKMRIQRNGDISDLLKGLGLNKMFDPKVANFSRLSNTVGLFVRAVIHEAVVEVNEEGTTAAAVTAGYGDRILPDLQFVVNRPFSFTIYNTKAHTVLFWGRVTRPQPL